MNNFLEGVDVDSVPLYESELYLFCVNSFLSYIFQYHLKHNLITGVLSNSLYQFLQSFYTLN